MAKKMKTLDKPLLDRDGLDRLLTLIKGKIDNLPTSDAVEHINARIDTQKPVTLRLRGVPSGVETATWWAFHADPVVLPLTRAGGEVTIRIPALTAWNCGWLMLCEK